MKGMKSAQEFQGPPPIGNYLAKVTAAEAKQSASSGADMISLSLEIRQPEEYAGRKLFDNIMTDGSTSGGGFGKQKLRGLGIDVDSTDEEIPDTQIAEQLLGAEVWVAIKHEARMGKNPSTGAYDVPQYDVVNGKQVQQQKAVIARYLGPQAEGETAVEPAPAAEPEAPKAEAAPAAKPAAGKATPPWQAAAKGAAKPAAAAKK